MLNALCLFKQQTTSNLGWLKCSVFSCAFVHSVSFPVGKKVIEWAWCLVIIIYHAAGTHWEESSLLDLMKNI